MNINKQVKATDPDSNSNGIIRYNRLIGEDPVISGLRLDPKSGEISIIKENIFDREKSDSKNGHK